MEKSKRYTFGDLFFWGWLFSVFLYCVPLYASNAPFIAYAGDNTQSPPSQQDYESFGIDGVTAENIEQINSLVAAADASAVTTQNQVQALVASIIIRNYAADQSNPAPTLANYTTLGFKAVTQAAVPELNQAVAQLNAEAVDSTEELRSLVHSVLLARDRTQHCGADYSSAFTDGGGFFNAPWAPHLNVFTALGEDGRITSWGESGAGGSGEPTENGFISVRSTYFAVAALHVDGYITAWGTPDFGGTGAPTDGGYIALYSNRSVFAALKADGSITVWGEADTLEPEIVYTGVSGAPTAQGYVRIFSTGNAFAALKDDGSIASWGGGEDGDNVLSSPTDGGYISISTTGSAFAARRADGSIAVWGNESEGGANAPTDAGYISIASSWGAFAALNESGAISAWGNATSGGNGAPSDGGYRSIHSNISAFAALKSDGSIRGWGDPDSGGDDAPIDSGYIAIVPNDIAFAALKADGSITAWGDEYSGGSGAPTGNGYVSIVGNVSAFAALKADGSITTWGDTDYGAGPDTPADAGYLAISSNDMAFAALKADGSIVAWGDASSGGVGEPTDSGYVSINGTAPGQKRHCNSPTPMPLHYIQQYAETGENPPTQTVYRQAGVTHFDATHLNAVNAAIAAETQASLPDLASIDQLARDTVAQQEAFLHLQGYATGSHATPPTLATYDQANLNGVSSAILAEVNTLVAGLGALTEAGLDDLQSAIDVIATRWRIQQYAANAENTAPSLADYLTLGLSQVTSDNLELVNTEVALLVPNELSSTALVEAAVDLILVLAPIKDYADNSASTAPSIGTYAQAGVAGVNAQNLAMVNQEVAVLSATDIDTLAKLQLVIDKAHTRFVSQNNALAIIQSYAADGLNAPDLSHYIDAQLSGVSDSNLALVNHIVAAAADAEVDSQEKIQRLIHAAETIQRIADYAESEANTPPLIGDFQAAHVLGVNALNVNDVNLALSAVSRTEADSQGEIQTLVNGVIAQQVSMALITGYAAGGGTAVPSVADYIRLGVNAVDGDNIQAVNARVAELGVAKVGSTAALQALVNYVVAARLIQQYATDKALAPSAQHYQDFGVHEVFTENLADINQSVADVSANEVDTPEKVQAIVDRIVASHRIEQLAAGILTSLEVEQYLFADIVDVSVDNLAAVNAAVASRSPEEVDSPNKVQDLVDQINAINKLKAFTQDSTGMSPSLATYIYAGVQGVTIANVDDMNEALAKQLSSWIDTPSDLQALVDEVLSQRQARTGIDAYLADNTQTPPTVSDFANSGIQGVNAENIQAVLETLRHALPAQANTRDAIQSWVDQALAEKAAWQRVLALAEGRTHNPPTFMDFSLLRVSGVDSGSIDAVNSAIAERMPEDVDSVDELQSVVWAALSKQAAERLIMLYNIHLNTEVPSVATYRQAGVLGVTASNLDAVNEALREKLPNEIDTTPELQAFVDSVIGSDQSGPAQALIQAFASDSSAPAPSLIHYAQAGIDGVMASNLDAVNNAIATSHGSELNTREKIQRLVSAVLDRLRAQQTIERFAADASHVSPSVTDYVLAGVKGVSDAILEELNQLVSMLDNDAINSASKLQKQVSRVQAREKIQRFVADASANPVPNLNDFKMLGVAGIDNDSIGSINMALGRLPVDEFSTIDNALFALIRLVNAEKIYAFWVDGSQARPQVSHYVAIGLAEINEENIHAVNYHLNQFGGPTLSLDVQGIVSEVQRALALIKIDDYRQDHTGPEPTVWDFRKAAVVGVSSMTLGRVLQALKNPDLGEIVEPMLLQDVISEVNQDDENIQAAVQMIQQFSGDNGTAEPTISTYENAAVNGVTGQILASVNQLISERLDRDKDSTRDIQASVDQVISAYSAYQTITAYIQDQAQPKPTPDDYEELGVNGVEKSNLEAINAQIDFNAFASPEAMRREVIRALAIEKIRQYAEDNTAPAPVAADYQNAGIGGVDESNVAQINALLYQHIAEDDFQRAVQNQVGEVNAGIVAKNNAMDKIKAYRIDATRPAPTLSDYRDAGLAQITAETVAALNTRVTELPLDVFNTPEGTLNALQAQQAHARAQVIEREAARQMVLNFARLPNMPEPRVDDYQKAGMTTVNNENILVINTALAARRSDEAPTLESLQSTVENASNSRFDGDADGVPDQLELTSDSDGDGLADTLDNDSDNDGLSDALESGLSANQLARLFSDAAKNNTHLALDGVALRDWDGDGVPDIRDIDADNDGLPDLVEAGGMDANGDGRVDAFADSNGDGVHDAFALLPLELPDTDQDGVQDHFDRDNDNDGLSTLLEAGGEDPSNVGVVLGQIDNDADGVPDVVDVDQTGGLDSDLDGIDDRYDADIAKLKDADGDGIADIADADADGDGWADMFSASGGGEPLMPADTDEDGRYDFLDRDSDGDGISDAQEAGFPDVDQDGRHDHWQDQDNDGIADAVDVDFQNGQDQDNDGIVDFADASVTGARDVDGDGISDQYDSDPDGDGMVFTHDVFGGGSMNEPDTDTDGTPDRLDKNNGRFVTGGGLDWAMLLLLFVFSAAWLHGLKRRR